jgi:hypothetical protein
LGFLDQARTSAVREATRHCGQGRAADSNSTRRDEIGFLQVGALGHQLAAEGGKEISMTDDACRLKKYLMKVVEDVREKARIKLSNAEVVEKLAKRVDDLDSDEIREFAGGIAHWIDGLGMDPENYLLMVNKKLEQQKSQEK